MLFSKIKKFERPLLLLLLLLLFYEVEVIPSLSVSTIRVKIKIALISVKNDSTALLLGQNRNLLERWVYFISFSRDQAVFTRWVSPISLFSRLVRDTFKTILSR